MNGVVDLTHVVVVVDEGEFVGDAELGIGMPDGGYDVELDAGYDGYDADIGCDCLESTDDAQLGPAVVDDDDE